MEIWWNNFISSCCYICATHTAIQIEEEWRDSLLPSPLSISHHAAAPPSTLPLSRFPAFLRLSLSLSLSLLRSPPIFQPSWDLHRIHPPYVFVCVRFPMWTACVSVQTCGFAADGKDSWSAQDFSLCIFTTFLTSLQNLSIKESHLSSSWGSISMESSTLSPVYWI